MSIVRGQHWSLSGIFPRETSEEQPVKSAMAAWILLSAIGVAIIALPDDDRRLVSLSEAHGLSALDAAGIGFLLAGWLVFVGALVRRRGTIVARLQGDRHVIVLPFVAGVGIGLVVASVASEFDGWWVVGAGLLIVVQLWLAMTSHSQ